MFTNFSPCKGSYVLNQFPSNVMFGMNGFHVSASGAIQGHHGPFVYMVKVILSVFVWAENNVEKQQNAGDQHLLSPIFHVFKSLLSQSL